MDADSFHFSGWVFTGSASNIGSAYKYPQGIGALPDTDSIASAADHDTGEEPTGDPSSHTHALYPCGCKG